MDTQRFVQLFIYNIHTTVCVYVGIHVPASERVQYFVCLVMLLLPKKNKKS